MQMTGGYVRGKFDKRSFRHPGQALTHPGRVLSMPGWAALGVVSAAKSARDCRCRNGEGDAHLLASQRFRRSRRLAHTRLPGVRSLALLLCLHLSAAKAFLPALLRPRSRSVGVRSVVVMNKVRGYYTVSESNGKGWDLMQDEVEGAVFLGNRGARRLFTSGFSHQAPTLASPIKPSDRVKQLNHLRDLQEAHKSLKNEIAQLQKPRGARRVLPSDIMLKSLKKKKLAVKDRIVALTGLLEKKERASEAESAQALRPKRLGQGACASVVLGRDVSTGEEVAIKLEPVEKGGGSRLLHEFTVLRSLKGAPGFPNARYYGTQDIMGTRSDFLVLDRLGPSVDDLWWAETGGAGGLPPHMVLALAAQMLELIRQLHDRGYVHRDLKPENFLFGVAGHTSKTLHLIDLGISRKVPGSNPSSQRAVTEVTVAQGKGSKRSRGAKGGVNDELAGDVGVEAPSSLEFAGTCRCACMLCLLVHAQTQHTH